MSKDYLIDVTLTKQYGTDVLNLAFGKEADSDEILKELDTKINELIDNKSIKGGVLLLVNGRCTIINAVYLGKKLAPYYSTIAINDPKIQAYVVSITTNSNYKFAERII